MRAVARNDYNQALAIARWPLREMLVAYVELLRAQVLEEYRHSQLLYQVRNAFGGGEEKPPAIPELLREPQRK